MMESPKIFVIIVTYKGQRWYDKCFGSLRESTIPLQTIVVDNSPGDEDVAYIKEHFPEVHLIKTNENLGFGRANNLGMRYALDHGCDYVFLLNQDAWIEPDSIAKLVTIADKHHEYGIISPMHLSADMQHLNFLIDGNLYNHDLLSDAYTCHFKDIYTINYVNAAAWLLPRHTLENIGGFCPLIYHYGEDDDYLNRIHYHGLLVGLVPSSKIVHDSSTQLDNKIALFKKANSENIDIFLNINDQKSTKSWIQYLLWKLFKSFIHHRNTDVYMKQINVLRANKKEIERCRAAHKIKQANWL